MTPGARRDDDTATPSTAAAARAARGRSPAIAFAVVVGAIFLAVFLSRFTPAAIALRRIAEPLAAATVVLLAAYAAGALALALARAIFRRVARLRAPGSAAEPAAVLLVGLPAFGTMVAVLAWTGVAVDLLVSLFSLVMAAVGAFLLVRGRRPLPGRVEAWDVALLGPPIAIALLGALAPVNSPDELVYKLAVPKAYLLFGGMIDLPLNSQSYLSTALSHASLAALALSGGIAAKLVHAALFVAVLAEVRRLGEKVHPGAGTWVTAVVAWTPALMLIAGWAWTEWAVLGLLLLSYRGWLELEQRPTAGAAALVTAALAGAAAIKYTALPWIAVFTVVAVVRLARRGGAAARGDLTPAAGREIDHPGLGRLLAAAALVLIALGAFFYARNWMWSGSPVAPFLVEGAPAVEQYRTQGKLSGWQELLLGYDIVHSGVVDDALGILSPLCALLAPLGARRNPVARDLFWIGLVPLPFLIALAPLSRLLLTSVVPLAVVGAAYLARSWRALESALLRGVVAALGGVALLAQLLLVLWVMVTSHEPLGVVLGAETEAAYAARMRSYTAAYRWLESNTPPQSRVLLIGENRSYALERATYSGGNFDGARMAQFLGRHRDARELERALRGLGVTHVIVHWPWLRVEGRASKEPGMLEREFLLPLPQATARVLQDFVDRVASRRYQDEAYSIYELPAVDASRQ